MRKTAILFIAMSFFSYSCIGRGTVKGYENNEVIKEDVMDSGSQLLSMADTVKKYLALQENSPYMDDYADFPEDVIHIATIDDVMVTLPFMVAGLHNNGYVTPGEDDFLGTVKRVFNVDLSNSTGDMVMLLGPNQKIKSKDAQLRKYHFDSGYFIASKKHRIVFYSDFLRNFVEMIGDEVKVKTPPAGILALNMYLFNNNKASIHVLSSFNTYAFEPGFLLEDPFYYFYYDQDQLWNSTVFKLAREKVNGMYPTSFRPIKYFFRHREGGLYINENLLQTVKNLTRDDDCFYLELLGFYLYDIASNQIEHDYTDADMTQMFCRFAILEYDLRRRHLRDDNDQIEIWANMPFTHVINYHSPQYLERLEQEGGNEDGLEKIYSLIQEGVEAR